MIGAEADGALLLLRLRLVLALVRLTWLMLFVVVVVIILYEPELDPDLVDLKFPRLVVSFRA